jgi:hypothetical protein
MITRTGVGALRMLRGGSDLSIRLLSHFLFLYLSTMRKEKRGGTRPQYPQEHVSPDLSSGQEGFFRSKPFKLRFPRVLTLIDAGEPAKEGEP